MIVRGCRRRVVIVVEMEGRYERCDVVRNGGLSCGGEVLGGGCGVSNARGGRGGYGGIVGCYSLK